MGREWDGRGGAAQVGDGAGSPGRGVALLGLGAADYVEPGPRNRRGRWRNSAGGGRAFGRLGGEIQGWRAQILSVLVGLLGPRPWASALVSAAPPGPG